MNTSTKESEEVPHRELTDEDEIGFLTLLAILVRHKRMVFFLPLICATTAAFVSLALPNTYIGTARILPPQQTSAPLAAALLGDLGGLTTGNAVGSALGLRNPSDLYVSMLQSRTIADSLIKRFELQELYDEDSLVETREELARSSSIRGEKTGIIVIEVEDRDPSRAAEIANAYVEELDLLTQKVAVTTAGRQRVFLEGQLRQAKEQLSDAEVALRTTQQKTGLINLTDQGRATIESVAYLQAQIQAKQVQLGAMRTSMTESNPDYIRTQRELSGLQAELDKVEKIGSAESGAVIPSAGTLPERGLEYVRKFRDVQYFQTLFDLIAKQYEIAKSQEAAETSLIQVLDQALAPDKKAKPHRALIVFVTATVALILAAMLALVMDARERARKDLAKARLLDEIEKGFLRWRKPTGDAVPK